MKTKNNLLPFIWIIALVFLISGCSNNESKSEAKKLLEKQSEVTKAEKTNANAFGENVVKNDTQQSIKTEQQEKKKIVEKTKADEVIEQQNNQDIAKQVSELKKQLETFSRELSDLQIQNSELSKKKEKINIKDEQLNEQKSIVKDRLITGITYIDSSLNELDRQTVLKQKEFDLNEQKILLANKKTDILEDEKSILYRKKNEILKNNANDSELDEYDRKIEEVNKQLIEEQNNIKEAEKDKDYLKSWLKNAGDVSHELKILMEKEYEKNKSIEKFIKDEMAKLNIEKESLHDKVNEIESSKIRLKEEQSKISDKSDNLKVENKTAKPNELLSETSVQEKNQSVTDKQESILNKELTGNEELSIDSSSAYTIKEDALKDDKSLKNIQQGNEEFKSKKLSPFGRAIIIIAFLGTILILIMYLVGKRKRDKK